eukprot:jgi/Mesen1/3125/ME000184S02192
MEPAVVNILSFSNLMATILWAIYIICSHILAARKGLPPENASTEEQEEGQSTKLCVVTGAQHRDARVEVVALDLCSTSSIVQFAQHVKQHCLLQRGGRQAPSQLDLLVNNAGMLAATRRMTAAGIESTVASNYLGPFMLTQQLLPLMRPGGRILNVASFTHRSVRRVYLGLPALKAGAVCQVSSSAGPVGRSASFVPAYHYQASKLCVVMFTYELHRQLALQAAGGTQISAIAVDPGLVDTNIMREMPRWLVVAGSGVLKSLRLMRPPSDGAAALLRAADAPPGVSGVYMFGPQGVQLKSSRLSQDRQLAADLWESSSEIAEELLRSAKGGPC